MTSWQRGFSFLVNLRFRLLRTLLTIVIFFLISFLDKCQLVLSAKAANYSHLLESIYCLILKSYINSQSTDQREGRKDKFKREFPVFLWSAYRRNMLITFRGSSLNSKKAVQSKRKQLMQASEAILLVFFLLVNKMPNNKVETDEFIDC